MILFPKPTPKEIARVIVGGIIFIFCTYCFIYFLQTNPKPSIDSGVDILIYELGELISGIGFMTLVILIIIGLYKLFFE